MKLINLLLLPLDKIGDIAESHNEILEEIVEEIENEIDEEDE